MRVWSLARKMRAGARKPKECSETRPSPAVEIVEPLGHRHVARIVGARPAAGLVRLRRCRRPAPARDSATVAREHSVRGLERSRRSTAPCSSDPDRARRLVDGRRSRSGDGDRRRAVGLAGSAAPAAAAGFLRRFLPPRLPRRVLRFATGAPVRRRASCAPSGSASSPRRRRRSWSSTASSIRLGDCLLDHLGRDGARRRGSPRDVDPRRPAPGRRLGLLRRGAVRVPARGLGGLVGASTAAIVVGSSSGSPSPSRSPIGRDSGACRLAAAAAAARATAGALLRGRRRRRHRRSPASVSSTSSSSLVERLDDIVRRRRRRASRRRRRRLVDDRQSSGSPRLVAVPALRPACAWRERASASRPRSRT